MMIDSSEIVITISWAQLLLVAVVFLNGLWNTSIGSTGGITFATMAATLSPTVAIPIQSVVEGVSGAYRSWTLRGYVSRVFMFLFVLGGAAGGAIGYLLLTRIGAMGSTETSESVLRVIIAVLILGGTWLPLGQAIARLGAAPLAIGTITTTMSMFVGGMGALIASSVESRGEGHRIVIATSNTAVISQYVLRLVVFGLIGFSFAAHAGLIIVLTITSLLGTWLGRRILVNIDPDKARQVFRLLVSAIAGSMIVRALI